MIIRVTVNDNDFYYVMIGFMKSLWNYKRNSKPTSEMSIDELEKELDRHIEHEKILQLVNPNNDRQFSSEEEQSLIAYLHKRFAEYIETVDKKSDTKEYLKQHLQIKIQKSFTDKWENGEAFYWLQHSRTIVNQ